jgi:hypothetical protein
LDLTQAKDSKTNLNLFILTPIQNDWKESILSDIGTLVDQRLNEIKAKATNKKL